MKVLSSCLRNSYLLNSTGKKTSPFLLSKTASTEACKWHSSSSSQEEAEEIQSRLSDLNSVQGWKNLEYFKQDQHVKMNHLFKMLLKMTLHMSSCCCFPYWHVGRKFPRSANFFFSISSQENSLIKVTHCQNILFILFIQCFAEREAQVLYQRLNC